MPKKLTEVNYKTQPLMSSTQISDRNFTEKPAGKPTTAHHMPSTASLSTPITDQDLISNDTLRACIDKIGSIELKRLTIIENEMDKMLQGNTD